MSDSITESNSFERNANAVVLDNKYFLVRLIYKGRSHNLYLGSEALNKDDPNTYYLIEMKSQEQYNSFICDERIIKKCMIVFIIQIVFSVNNTKDNTIRNIQIQEYGIQIQYKGKMWSISQTLFSTLKQKISDQVFATLAIEAISVLEKMHSASIVYCYLKPKKFVTLHRGVQLLLTDLNFHKNIIEIVIKLEYQKQISICFSIKQIFKFKSASRDKKSNKLNKEPCPRDDLQSLAYILINFYIGGRLFKTKQEKTKSDKIKEVELQKMNLIIEKAFLSQPKEIIQFYYHVKLSNIDQYKIINYDELKSYFYKMIQKNDNTTNLKSYPWNQELIENQKQSSASSLSSVVKDDEKESDDSLIEEQSILRVIEQLKQITKTKNYFQNLIIDLLNFYYFYYAQLCLYKYFKINLIVIKRFCITILVNHSNQENVQFYNKPIYLKLIY